MARHITTVDETDLEHLAEIEAGWTHHGAHALRDEELAEPTLFAGEDPGHHGPYRVTLLLAALSGVGLLMTGLVAVLVP